MFRIAVGGIHTECSTYSPVLIRAEDFRVLRGAELPAFVGCLMAGADFVKGSRFVQGGGTADMGPVRRAGNWALRGLVRASFGGRYSDLCYGYNAFWRHVLPVIDGDADGFEIETQIVTHSLRAGLRVTEVPSVEAARRSGTSNLHTVRDGCRVLRELVGARTWSLPAAPAVPPPIRVHA